MMLIDYFAFLFMLSCACIVLFIIREVALNVLRVIVANFKRNPGTSAVLSILALGAIVGLVGIIVLGAEG